MRSFLIKSNNYRPGNLGIYNYQVNIDENSGSVTLLTNVGEYILGGNGDIKLTNYYTKEEIDNIIQDLESGEIDLTRYYTKEQIDDLLDNIETGNVDLTNYFTKTEVEEYVITQTDGYVDMATLDIITDNKISNATLDLVEKEPFNNLTSKVNTLEDRVNNIDTGDIDLSEYAKMEDIEGFITEAEVDSKINNIVVDLTPIEESLDNKVDKVDNKGLSTDDFIASEYYNRGELDDLISNVEVDLTDYATEAYVQTEIGNIEFPTVDLEPYATKAEIDTKLEGYPTTSVVEGMIDGITAGDIDLAGYYNKEEVDTKLLLKVDKVEGKDLSSNDFTDSYKESLDGLSNALDSKADKNETNLEIERLDNKIDSNTTILAQKANQDTTYTKTEVDNIIPNLDDYATEDYVTNAIDGIDIPSITGLVTEDDLNTALNEKIDNTYKAEVTTEINNAISGLNIDDYAKIDSLDAKLDTSEFETYKTNIATSLSDLEDRIDNLSSVQITTVDVLPETGETNIIYLVPKGGENLTNNTKDEYIWISEGDSGRFEFIGTTEIDLSNYYTKAEIFTKDETTTLIDTVIAGEIDLTNYYTKLESDNAITTAITDLDLDNKLSSKAEAEHTHTISDITDLSNTLSNKVDKSELGLYTTTDNLNKDLVGLSNVDNTSDLNKPVSTATQAALNSKAESVHTHTISEIVDIQDALNLKANQETTYTKGEVDGLFANNSGGSLVKVDLEDGTVAYKLDSNGLIPTASSIDLRTGNQTTNLGQYSVCVSAELPEGLKSTASGAASTVSGGASNTASGEMSTVPGGFMNTASGETSTVSGGQSNTASGVTSTISGGQHNTASGVASTVSGGLHNTATNYSETVVGMYSDNTGTPETSRVEGSPIFRVGIGTVNNRRDGFQVKNDGKVYAPHQTIALTTDPTQLVTKEYVDSIGGGTTYQMITAGGSYTFGSEYENYIILTNSTNDITITIPSGNTNYIVRNINPTGRVFFTAGTGATIHASSIGLVDDQYVISGYGMMSVIVYGTDIILTGGI